MSVGVHFPATETTRSVATPATLGYPPDWPRPVRASPILPVAHPPVGTITSSICRPCLTNSRLGNTPDSLILAGFLGLAPRLRRPKGAYVSSSGRGSRWGVTCAESVTDQGRTGQNVCLPVLICNGPARWAVHSSLFLVARRAARARGVPLQGNRILLQQQLDLISHFPTDLFAFGGDSSLGGSLLAPQVEHRSPQDSNLVSSMADREAALFFMEGNVQAPMQGILEPPRATRTARNRGRVCRDKLEIWECVSTVLWPSRRRAKSARNRFCQSGPSGSGSTYWLYSGALRHHCGGYPFGQGPSPRCDVSHKHALQMALTVPR